MAEKSSALAQPEAGATLRTWLTYTVSEYERHGLALGQIATNANDEALYLLLHALGLPLDSRVNVLRRKVEAQETAKLAELLSKRIRDRVPAAYLTREAFLGAERFYVDERVIIPRSYFLEIIPQQLDAWLPENKKVRRIVDVCTGSGCLAILLAKHFSDAVVDAIDLSPDALTVAKINFEAHRLTSRVTFYTSDVFDQVPPALYDLILSNPPYEPSAHVDAMPAEFHREPRMALDGGKDGMEIIRKLLRQAKSRLQPHGIVAIEVGGLRDAIDREFGHLDPHWLHTEDGSDCVCLFHAQTLERENKS